MTSALDSRSIFLIGFMATGKSTVGRELAQLIDRPFVDLDEVIESGAGQSVREIFDEHGADHFRRLEAAALREVIRGRPAVVATGGGTPCYERGLERMREDGFTVSLSAPLPELLERVDDRSTRPLLGKSPDELAALYAAREPIYRQAHATIRTEGKSPREIAHAISDLIAAAIHVPGYALADASLVIASGVVCPIIVAPGSLNRLGELGWRMLGPRCKTVGIISDSNVAPLYGQRARESLESEGFSVIEAVVPAGEQAKQFSQFQQLCEHMVSSGLDRSSAIVALGGGVVGDLAGFVAASLFRGIRCVQVPTTILAMVDSAIGGKTGINIAAGKNLVGAFWQPAFVHADPEVLVTLPLRERKAAFGELVKYALLDGEELFGMVDQLAPAMASEAGELPRELTEVIRRCAAIKSWIVTRDEREQTGERALLNLGHTVGHAIEAATGYETFLHGEAVALGLLAAARLSARLGLCEPALYDRIEATLRRAGLDVALEPWLIEDVLSRIGVDKKRTGSRVGFITLERVGAPAITPIELAELVRTLQP